MNVRLKYDLPFTAGIYHHGGFCMNNYNFKVLMVTTTTDAEDQTTAFDRLKYFVYNCIESTIFIDESETEQCNKFIQAGLNITTLPGTPVDQLIGIMLYHKLNAVMEGRIIVFETELSSAVGEYMTYLHSEHEDIADLVQPAWWNVPDLTHSDFKHEAIDNVVAIPQATAWRDLNLAWLDESAESDTGNVVVFANFKPEDDTK